MPTYVKSLRNVLDADANAISINSNAYLYSDQAEALNSGDQLFIISEYATRYKELFLNNGSTNEEAGNAVTASLKDSGGNYPDPVSFNIAAGVQIIFDVGPNPVSNYGTQVGILDGVGLRHYHHQIQFGLYLDGTVVTTGWFGGTTTTDYMSDNFSANGTILEAGQGTGTWDQNNISLGNLRGIQKPITAVAGTGLGTTFTNIFVGDPNGSQTGTGFGAGEVTGRFTEDGVDKMLGNSINSTNISIGGYGDGI
tara:strand:+ start:525 stop:1283 length:759 start_codon:yes stop_codon:yes gene_type:complete